MVYDIGFPTVGNPAGGARCRCTCRVWPVPLSRSAKGSEAMMESVGKWEASSTKTVEHRGFHPEKRWKIVDLSINDGNLRRKTINPNWGTMWCMNRIKSDPGDGSRGG